MAKNYEVMVYGQSTFQQQSNRQFEIAFSEPDNGVNDETGILLFISGYEAAIAAVALDAKFIEKHITLDKNMEGPDHKASMGPKEFKRYVQYIRNTEALLGNGIKKPTEREKVIMRDVRRSIVAACDLKKGTMIKKDMIMYKRPGNGINPELSYILIGREVKRDIKKDEIIKWEDI